MTDVDVFDRSYLFVDVHAAANSETVASLFEAAAAALRRHGEVDVHHVAFDASERPGTSTTSLTIYYDRVERRRQPRS